MALITDIVIVLIGFVGPLVATFVPVFRYGQRHKWGSREYGFACVPLTLFWGWFYGKFVFKVSDAVLVQGLAIAAFQMTVLFWSQHVMQMRRKQQEAEKKESTGEEQDSRKEI